MTVPTFLCECGHTTQDHGMSGECLIHPDLAVYDVLCGCTKMRPVGEEIVKVKKKPGSMGALKQV